MQAVHGRQNESFDDTQSLSTEYQYFVHAKELGTFADLIRKEGVPIPRSRKSLTPHMVFSSPKRLDMRIYKDDGLIWSYSIVKLKKSDQIVEQG